MIIMLEFSARMSLSCGVTSIVLNCNNGRPRKKKTKNCVVVLLIYIFNKICRYPTCRNTGVVFPSIFFFLFFIFPLLATCCSRFLALRCVNQNCGSFHNHCPKERNQSPGCRKRQNNTKKGNTIHRPTTRTGHSNEMSQKAKKM